MSDERDAQGLIDFLIQMGILRPVGYDENIGEEMYMMTDKASTFFPELPKMQERETNAAVFELWQRNMLDVVFDETGEPLVSLNKNSTDKNKIEAIEEEDLRRQMYMIVSIFTERYNENNK